MVFLNLLSKIVNAIVIVLELMLSVRFILLMFETSPSHNFLIWVLNTTNPLVVPFKSIFQQLTLAGFIIDFTTLFAIIAYGIAGMVLVKLISHPMKYT